MGVDLYWEDERRRKKGYNVGFGDGQQSMAKQIKDLSECQKKIEKIKEIYENDEPFKAMKIKKIIYGE